MPEGKAPAPFSQCPSDKNKLQENDDRDGDRQKRLRKSHSRPPTEGKIGMPSAHIKLLVFTNFTSYGKIKP
jgi:hypothetical protein